MATGGWPSHSQVLFLLALACLLCPCSAINRNMMRLLAFLLGVAYLTLAHALVVVTSGGQPRASTRITMSVASSPAATPSSGGQLTAQRYVATNRFRVKSGREAAFEKRWADRKSRLGLLDGFRFFCMMRRVGDEHADDVNYISCTVWETFADFDAWKRGDAFKEAHGGGTIGGIASMLIATAQNTKGKPKAAMWEGLLPVAMPPSTTSANGWREVFADGITMLDGECFIAMNRFTVSDGFEAAFESRFASRESTLSSHDGFKGFVLLRRDGKDDDGFTHSTWSVWEDRAAFEAWKGSERSAGAAKTESASAPSIYARPPVPTFYEGILMLESAKGV